MNGKRAASSGNGRYSDPDPGEGVDWKMGERAELAVMLVKDGNNVYTTCHASPWMYCRTRRGVELGTELRRGFRGILYRYCRWGTGDPVTEQKSQ